MSKNNLIAGFLLGTMCAILFAPQKGKVLRQSMDRARRTGGNELHPLKNAVSAYFSEILKQMIKEMPETIKHKNTFKITKL
jgi:gas vesicle protein